MSDSKSIRIFSIDDHPLMREGIAAIIRNEPDMLLVAEASNGREAIQGFREHRPDITLMDLRLPDSGGIDAMVAIRTEFAFEMKQVKSCCILSSRPTPRR